MVIESIRPWNTHWTGADVSSLILKHPGIRPAVARIVAELLAPQQKMWSLRPGPRQIGKTTSLGHAMRALMTTHGVPRRSVVFVPVDQESVAEASGGRLDSIIDAAISLSPPTSSEPLFLFLDEVQEMEAWATKLKAAWDRYHDMVRIVATGSSAAELTRHGAADLHGRIRTTRMYPMKFREIIDSHPGRGAHLPDAEWAAIRGLALDVRKALIDGRPGFPQAVDALHERIEGCPGVGPFLRASFQDAAVWGGYPVPRGGGGLSEVQRLDYFESAWNAVVAKDLQRTGTVKTHDFRSLFRQICRNPGGKFVPHKIASDLGIKADTAAEWKRLLEDLFLVQQLPPLKPNLQPSNQKDKAYPVDPGWTAYWLTVTDTTFWLGQPVLGEMVETLLVDHLRRLQFNVMGTSAPGFGYVESPEVDIAVNLGAQWLLVEAKYRKTPKAHLQNAGGPADFRVVATRTHFEGPDGAGSLFVPAHEVALWC